MKPGDKAYLILALLLAGVTLIVAGCVAPFLFNSLALPAALCVSGVACAAAAAVA